jgi:hypothetical protein
VGRTRVPCRRLAERSLELLSPKEGWIAWVADEDTLLTFGPSGWTDFGGALGAIQNLALLGVGTTADALNPFSAKLNKALWTAKTAGEGGDGDLRYTMNKETAADVLSILLQSGFSGRAEIGLIGNDDVTIKVSPDGSSWLNAVTIDKDDGSVSLAGSLAVDTSLLVVDAANARILSGLSAAKTNLRYFNGAQSTPAVQRFGTSIASSALALIHENNSAGNNPTLYFARGRTGGAAAGSSDTLGIIGFNAHDGAADYCMAAMVRAVVDGQANSAGNVNALLAFYTNPGGPRRSSACVSTATAISPWAAPTSSLMPAGISGCIHTQLPLCRWRAPRPGS